MKSLFACILLNLFSELYSIKIPEKTIRKTVDSTSKCHFSVHHGGPEGLEITGTNLYSELYYKIKCQEQTGYCLHVFNCTVKSDKPDTEPYRIIDENGCTLEPSIFGNVWYPNDFTGGINNPYPVQFRGSNSAVQVFCETTMVPNMESKCERTKCPTSE